MKKMSFSLDEVRSQIKSQRNIPTENEETRFGKNKISNNDDYFIRISEAKKLNGTTQVTDEQVKQMMSTIQTQNQTINQQSQKVNELENYIKQLTGVTKQHEAKIVEYNNFVNKYNNTLEFNKKEFDDRQLFVIDILEKYSDSTGNQSDGFKASALGTLVELESEGEIPKGQVKSIMESIYPTRSKGPGSFKQEKMFGGYPHYRGFKAKDIVANIIDDRDSLKIMVATQSAVLPQINSSSASPVYNGASSPAPIMARQ